MLFRQVHHGAMFKTAIVIIAASVTRAAVSSAQEPTRIESSITCGDCALLVEHVASLGSADGPGALVSDPVSVARDSRGSYYLAQFRNRSEILVFDETGRFRKRIGRAGRGPGEFTDIQVLRIGRGDTLHVYERGTQRHTVISPSGDYVRSVPVHMNLQDVVVLENGEEVFNGIVPSPDRIGLPLHTLDSHGDPKDSFGSHRDFAAYRADLPYLSWRRMTPGGANRVWAAPPTQYVIELWDTDGKRHAALVREADWFQPYTERILPTPDNPSPPLLADIHHDREGKLWVAVLVPSLDWAEKLGEPMDTPMRRRYRASNPEAWNTIIEILEYVPGEAGANLVISTRVAPSLRGFVDEDRVYAYREDEEGVPVVDIWRLRLEKP